MEKVIRALDEKKFLKPCFSSRGLYNSNLGKTVSVGLCKLVEEKLQAELASRPFAFFIDGWSKTGQSHLTVGVRYFLQGVGLKVRLFDDLSYINDGTGKALYCLVRKSLLDSHGTHCI
jgi:hypothetical protein